MPIAIIVHGGAGDISSDRTGIAQTGCREAALVGWRILQAGGSALDAVEAAVRSLEDNPNFNAGTGASLTNEGTIQLDAGIMDGHVLGVGAVADVELIKNPISLARKVLESPHVLLVGKGAQQFAQEQGIPSCSLEDLMTERQFNNWKEATSTTSTTNAGTDLSRSTTPTTNVGADLSRPGTNPMLLAPTRPGNAAGASPAAQAARTNGERGFASPAAQAAALSGEPPIDRPEEEQHGTVGAVALDTSGTLAAATSTGGIPNKYPGRVGDSPLVGCGFYADENAAISCTGHGEDFIRLLIAKRAADFVARGDTARDAAQAAIAMLGARASGTGGLIVVDRLGNVGFAWNSQHMSYAYIIEGMQEPMAGV